jgi:hypothetical protein
VESVTVRQLVRRRLFAAAIGLAIFVVLGLVGTTDAWRQPWLFVGLGIALSATFLEPYFSTPRAAVVNSLGGIAACVGADTGSIEDLWLGLAIFFGVVLVTGAIASTTPEGRLNAVTRQVASRFGHAVTVGAAVLALIIITDAELGQAGYQELAVGSAVLIASVSFDWFGVWSRLTGAQITATAVSATGPKMVLLAGSPVELQEGEALEVEGAGGRHARGRVVARMPHAEGLRYQIALSDDWSVICSGFPQDLAVSKLSTDDELVGAVAEGTTQRTLEFEPIRRLNIADPLVLRPGGRPILYQVARLRLTQSTWPGSAAIVPRATAHLVGAPRDNRIDSISYLPDPHEPVDLAAGMAGGLDGSYYELGHVKGTAIPIGIRVDAERRGHIAVLGMSGMGKTAVTQRICRTLGNNNVVVAMDTTGEYSGRLQYPPWVEGDLTTQGHFVYEPVGDPPSRAREFINNCMQAGGSEYQAGRDPAARFLVLEEAHTFLPEWNVSLRPQQDEVAVSTRMIMQARKYGITIMLVSQRTAVVSKSALSQCENYIILKTLDHTGLEYLESLVGGEMRDAIPTLDRFEAMCVGPAFNSDEPVIVTLSEP